MTPRESPRGNIEARRGQLPRRLGTPAPRRSYGSPARLISPRRAIIRDSRRFWRAAGLVGSVVAVGWVVVALSLGLIMDAAYADRVLPGSVLAGRDISGMSTDEVAAVITQAQNEISVDLTVDGTTRTATGADCGIVVNRQQIMSSSLDDSRHSLWIYRMRDQQVIPLTLSIDAERFNDWGAAAFPDSFRPAVDAAAVYDPVAQQFTVKPSQPGRGASQAVLDQLAAVLTSQSGKASFNLTPALIAAPVSDADAAITRDWFNHRLSRTYALVDGEQTLYTLAKDDIAQMVGAGLGEFDTAAALGFIQNTLAPIVNTQPVAQSVVTDPSGNTVEVPQPGQVGRRLANAGELAEDIVMRLTLGQDATIPITFTTLPFDTENTISMAPADAAVAEQLAYLLNFALDYNTGRWGDYNPAGGDCANFTSQGLHVRGIAMDPTWYSRGPGQASTAWVLASAMDAWVRSRGWDKFGLDQLDQLKLGDVAFFDWNANGTADHVMTVSRIDLGPAGLTVYFVSHNDDGLYRELNDVITEQHPGANAWFYSVPLRT